eukprot:scaffold3145_cov297-Prasinococcus_capsulatus_cf.AAC.2
MHVSCERAALGRSSRGAARCEAGRRSPWCSSRVARAGAHMRARPRRRSRRRVSAGSPRRPRALGALCGRSGKMAARGRAAPGRAAARALHSVALLAEARAR